MPIRTVLLYSQRVAALKNFFALREWLTLLLVMLLLAAGLGWQNGLGRIDQTLYDKLMSASGKPARDDIIIIGIDDYSLSELGRWPWPRQLHARLIDRLGAANPRAIGLDVILSEPEQAPRLGDAALQAALARNAKVVLPVVMSNTLTGHHASLPIPDLAGAAHKLGHIALNIDNDGVLRRVNLLEQDGARWWPHFSSQVGGDGLPQQRIPAQSGRGEPVLISYAGGSGHFRTVPYVAVLRGEVPAEFFTNKYVMVGATAVGMTDTYPTPVSGQSGGMAGIEINANILASLLDGTSLSAARPWQTALFSSLPVLLAMLCYFLFSPRAALLATAALIINSLGLSLIAFQYGLWIPPAAACIVLILVYPLWSWRRLDAAISYLGQEFSRLDSEPHLLPEIKDNGVRSADILERRINAMKNASRRVRDLRQFVSDSLDSLPDATLVTTVDGYVLLANKHAVDYFASVGFKKVNGALLPYLFLTPGLSPPHALDPSIDSPFNWWDLLDPERASTFGDGVDFRDKSGMELLVRSAPCRSNDNVLTGWIVSLVNISPIRSAEHSRDETLRFLSHDMRTPQASILALLELQANPASALPQTELFARIDRACRKTLGLADNFVQLARAESHEYRFEEVDFHDIVFDATDEMWTLANSKKITIRTEITSESFPVRVDRGLMTRALANLLSNAINYSPEGTTIVCAMTARQGLSGSRIACTITDQGYGIAAEDQIKLFQRFQRVDLPNQPRHDGIGLGLVFVKTVIERHHGEISFTSKVGIGTTFTVDLPVVAEHPRPDEGDQQL
ncbi:CHASE2 domain-containing protein [Actimicrobium antarcticum]|uniref:histidine kinase n=1 Tax=Actimicrobium antarcticum TaxID=1051899 RepID=A0ABP7TVI3_9BURK